MSLPVIIRPEAQKDIQSTYDSLEQLQPGLGRRFAGRVREVLESVESMPQLYGVVRQDVRAARVKQFRYVVYYVVFGDRVEVIAVLHGARDPSVWHSRSGEPGGQVWSVAAGVCGTWSTR